MLWHAMLCCAMLCSTLLSCVPLKWARSSHVRCPCSCLPRTIHACLQPSLHCPTACFCLRRWARSGRGSGPTAWGSSWRATMSRVRFAGRGMVWQVPKQSKQQVKSPMLLVFQGAALHLGTVRELSLYPPCRPPRVLQLPQRLPALLSYA